MKSFSIIALIFSLSRVAGASDSTLRESDFNHRYLGAKFNDGAKSGRVRHNTTFSPLELLCFSMSNTMDRAICKNRADTDCLTERMLTHQRSNTYKILPCTTDAVAKVNMTELRTASRCIKPETGKSQGLNSVWVACLVKNDAQSLIEWLVWHFLLGVNHAIIYDNESTDNLKVALEPFVKEGLVDYIYFPGVGVQAKAYTDALARAKKDSVTWLAAIDADEYIVPIKDHCITSMLARFVNKPTVGGLRLNWQYVTSMGKIWRWENGALDQTILDRTGFYTGKADVHVKTIARVARTYKFMDAHYALHTSGTAAVSPDNGKRGSYHFTNPPQTRTGVMLHMHVRTLEEWILKRLRGRGSVVRNQCPYCNASLEVLTAEWLCLNSGGFGIPDKDSRHKCRDTLKVPTLNQAANYWSTPLNKRLSAVMKEQSKRMHLVLLMPIETVPELLVTNETLVEAETSSPAVVDSQSGATE